MTAGTNDKRKVIALGVLGAVALYMVWANLLSGPDVPRRQVPVAQRQSESAHMPEIAVPASTPVERPAPQRPRNARRSDEFLPVYLARKPEDRPDPNTIDPTLKLELLAKVASVEPAGGTRNLFQISATPPPPPPKPGDKPKGPEPVVFVKYGPEAPKPPAPPPPPPPPPPITLKFYGFSTVRADGRKTAYFLDNDEILLAAEGDVLKRRYKVVRISPTQVIMLDTETKHEQPLPLAAEAQS